MQSHGETAVMKCVSIKWMREYMYIFVPRWGMRFLSQNKMNVFVSKLFDCWYGLFRSFIHVQREWVIRKTIRYGMWEKIPTLGPTIPAGNSASLVSHWNGGLSGWAFPVHPEHQWWILFIPFNLMMSCHLIPSHHISSYIISAYLTWVKIN